MAKTKKRNAIDVMESIMNFRPEIVPIEQLVPYENNPRQNKKTIAKLVKNIQQVGFTTVLLVDESMTIIAGHTRLLAAKKLGLTHLPVRIMKGFTAAEIKGQRLSDNRIAEESTWDELKLAIEMVALYEDGYDLDLTGFDPEEVSKLTEQLKKVGLVEEDAVPDAQAEAITKTGDVWICGDHRLICGDATMLHDVEKLMDGALADMVFTDPPYNVAYVGKTKKSMTIKNDDLGTGFYKLLYDSIVNMLMVSKGAIYICMSSSELDTLQKSFRDAGGHWSTFIIWAKNTFSLGRSDYQRQYEPILYGWKEGLKHFWCGARDQGDIWNFNRPVKNDLHPTMKPVALVERAIENSSKGRDIVLDCFGGSGTTMIACEKTGRAARLVELDPIYCDVIVRRWQEFSGKNAVLEANGETFAGIAEQKNL